MRVEMFNVGWITAPAVVYGQGEDPEERIRFPVPSYLIETDEERILIDAGLHPDAVADPEAFYGRPEAGIFGLEQERDITVQIDLATLTKIVVTHLHFDHVGALTLLPESVPIVMQRREWEAGRDAGAIARNFLYPRDYEALQERRLTLVDGDHDLLGDGSVELLLTPGHTPGHQSVRIGERLVIGADVGHYARTLDDLRFPAFGEDREAQASSAARLRGIRDAGVTVLPGHDPDVLRPGPVELASV
ncbi:MAG TPA: N-acyl homoserine lactonase family protein [Solirubrobacteraceae bacterium]|nr:N-acyl homoserine lactonase family protein [Solirubrobacteraceae bacterium]